MSGRIVSREAALERRHDPVLAGQIDGNGQMRTLRAGHFDAFLVEKNAGLSVTCSCQDFHRQGRCIHGDTLLHHYAATTEAPPAPEVEETSTAIQPAQPVPPANRPVAIPNVITLGHAHNRGQGTCPWLPEVRLQGEGSGRMEQWLQRCGLERQSDGTWVPPGQPRAATLIDLAYLTVEGVPQLEQSGWSSSATNWPIEVRDYHQSLSLDFRTVRNQVNFQVGGINKKERLFALQRLIDVALAYQDAPAEEFIAEIGATMTRGERLYIPHENVVSYRVIAMEKSHGLALLKACHKLAQVATVEGDQGWLPPTALADLAALENDVKGIRKSDRLQKLEALYNKAALEPSPQPSSFALPLDPAQIEGLTWMQTLYDAGYGGILADEMGVGKTAQLLAHIALLHERGLLEHQALLPVPKTALDNWQDECAKFVPDLDVLTWDGPNRMRLLPLLGDAHIVLTTPTLVHLDFKVFNRRWSIMAIDEAQDVRNPEIQTTSALSKIPADQKIPATGTPVENHLGDLWTLINLANPGLLGPHAPFMKQVNDPIIEQTERAPALMEGLKRSVSPFIMHRTRDQAGHNIPEPDAQRVPLEFNPQEREIYEIISSTLMREIQEVMGKPLAQRRGTVFKAIALMRQAACDVRLIKDNFAADLNPGISTKTRWCADFLAEERAQGRKVLVFANWIGYLDMLREEVERISGNAEYMGRINGNMTRIMRGKAQQAFKGGDLDTLYITTKTGGRALNLPEADTVLVCDGWWNPQPERQAIARTQRRGQTKIIKVRRPIIMDSIDEKLMQIQDNKAGVASSILDPAYLGKGGNGLSLDEMINLIRV